MIDRGRKVKKTQQFSHFLDSLKISKDFQNVRTEKKRASQNGMLFTLFRYFIAAAAAVRVFVQLKLANEIGLC